MVLFCGFHEYLSFFQRRLKVAKSFGTYLPAAAFAVHVAVGEEVRDQEGLVVERGHQGIGARVGVLDADLDRVILGEAARLRRRRPDLLLGLCRGHTPVRQTQTGHAPRATAATSFSSWPGIPAAVPVTQHNTHMHVLLFCCTFVNVLIQQLAVFCTSTSGTLDASTVDDGGRLGQEVQEERLAANCRIYYSVSCQRVEEENERSDL